MRSARCGGVQPRARGQIALLARLAATLLPTVFLPALPALLPAAGIARAEDRMNDTAQELMAVDRAFSELSQREGRREAFARFMAPAATVYREGREPIAGREAIMELFPPEAPGVLRWEPFFADAGVGGDLGYTLGTWWFEAAGEDGTPQVSRGHYVTIWKRQADGTWKYVFDTGVTASPAAPPAEPPAD